MPEPKAHCEACDAELYYEHQDGGGVGAFMPCGDCGPMAVCDSNGDHPVGVNNLVRTPDGDVCPSCAKEFANAEAAGSMNDLSGCETFR